MRLLCTVFLLLFASSSFASSAAPALPSFLSYKSNGIVLVYVNSARSGTVPTCATLQSGTYFPFAINATTNAGRVLLAGLLAARASGQMIWVFGSGLCDVQSDVESIDRFNYAD